MDIKIHQPHDTLFKRAFSKKAVVVDFLKSRLKPEICAQINMDTLQMVNGSFVSPELRKSYTDLVVSVKMNDEQGYIYFLMEHQTTPDPNMDLRLWEYNVKLMRQHREEGHTKLPAIINLVLYTSKSAYKGARRLVDSFQSPEAFSQMGYHEFLIELQKESKETIKKDGKAALAELVLRARNEIDFYNLVQDSEIVTMIGNADDSYAFALYIMARVPRSPKEILKKLKLPQETQQKVMSGLEKMINKREEKALQKGIEQGMEQGMHKGIATLLKDGLITKEQASRYLTK